MIKSYKQYTSIDLFKFIFAIVVVMIHTTPFMDVSEIHSWYFSNTFCNIAVPFFFVASGFLFFDKLDGNRENEKQRLKKYIGHIFKMYVVWCIIWLPWKVLYFKQVGVTPAVLIEYIRNLILVSGGDGLWYLVALLLSVVVTYWLYTRVQSPKVIVAIATIPYVIGIAISSWYGVFGNNFAVDWYYKIFVTVENGLMFGLMFTSVGMYIAKMRPKINRKKDIISCFICFIVLVIEAVFINKMGYNKDGICNLITLPLVIYYLFKVILSIDLKDKKIYSKLRDYSTLIYLSHCFIIRVLKLSFAALNINSSNTLLFVVTFILALIFAIAVRYLSREKNLSFFKLLY